MRLVGELLVGLGSVICIRSTVLIYSLIKHAFDKSFVCITIRMYQKSDQHP